MIPLISGFISLVLLSGMAFANVELGEPIPNPSLPGLDGVERNLLDPQRVTTFVFFDPQQSHSIEVLGDLAELQKNLEGSDVCWVGVVSDRMSSEAVISALDESGVTLDIVVDIGDRLYGELGVRLFPSIGIADAGGALLAYLPYAKVNYMGSLEAYLGHALGRIDDGALERALNPSSTDVGTEEAQSRRILKFAHMLWDREKREKALEKAQEAVEIAPDLADAHATVGIFQVEMGNCEEGLASLNRALEIDPDHFEALAALGKCDS